MQNTKEVTQLPFIGNIAKQIDIAQKEWLGINRNWISQEKNPLRIFEHIDDYVNRNGAKIIHISSNDQRSRTLKLKGTELHPNQFSNCYFPQGKDNEPSIGFHYESLIKSLKKFESKDVLAKVEAAHDFIKKISLIDENFSLDLPEIKFFDKGLTFISNCSDEEALLILFQFLREKRLSKNEYLVVLDGMFHNSKDDDFLQLLYKSSRPYHFSFAVTGVKDTYDPENCIFNNSSILINDEGIFNFEHVKYLRAK